MAKHRSPNYPFITLGDAIERVNRIYSADGTRPITAETAAQHMGYGGLNGASRKVISALRKYGLLAGRGDDVTVTKDSVTIIQDRELDDQSDRREALMRALTSSSVFADLHERYGADSSTIAINSYLAKNDFSKDGAASCAETYKASAEFVVKELEAYTPNDEDSEEDESDLDAAGDDMNAVNNANQKPPPGVVSTSWPLDSGLFAAQWPSKITENDREEIKMFLEMLERKIARSVDSDE